MRKAKFRFLEDWLSNGGMALLETPFAHRNERFPRGGRFWFHSGRLGEKTGPGEAAHAVELGLGTL